jgi:osmotically-inducible protein OsmY
VTEPPGAGSAEGSDSQPAGSASATTEGEASALESRIQNTLEKDPTLSPGSVRVAVSSEAVELVGNVATSRQRLTATRIAQSYAGSKRVVTRITVGASAQEPGNPEKKNVNGSQRQLRR